MKIFLSVAIVLSGCTQATRAPVSTEEVSELPSQVRGAAAREYHATTTTLRLFGIEPREDGAVAVIADEATWNTAAFHEGDSYDRNLMVSKIGRDSVILSGPRQRVVLRVGGSATARLVRHASDTVVEREGEVLLVDAGALQDLLDRTPDAVDARPFRSPMGTPGLGIRQVAVQGALAHLGLRAGDALLAVDGEPATPELLAGVAARLTMAGSELQLRILRNGEVFENRYRARLQ